MEFGRLKMKKFAHSFQNVTLDKIYGLDLTPFALTPQFDHRCSSFLFPQLHLNFKEASYPHYLILRALGISQMTLQLAFKSHNASQK